VESDNPDVSRGYRHHRLGYLVFVPSADLVECLMVGHKRRDFAIEVALQRTKRVRSIFHRVVQDRRADRLIVGAEPRQDSRDRYRMGNIRIATPASLTLMAIRCDLEGALDRFDVCTGLGG